MAMRPLSVTAADQPAVLQQALLAWFAANARDLPWRRTRDPYCILVAETMLQQTQVERVLPKYAAFLARFATLYDLAAAPAAEVIRLWSGLGYNRRAVNLQRAVQTVRDEYDGVFPRDVELLRRLPGIGPYTAGAVACFAFEQDVPFIDTNIRRVLLRLLFDPTDSDPPPGDRRLLELAAALIPTGQGWAWNQGLMELGALICTAARPVCRRCPLHDQCRTYAAWQQADTAIFDQPYPLPAEHRRRAAERPAEAFVGSRRYYRGRIIAALRDLSPGATLAPSALGPLVKPDYTAQDLAWLSDLLTGLARDGLLELLPTGARLPHADAEAG